MVMIDVREVSNRACHVRTQEDEPRMVARRIDSAGLTESGVGQGGGYRHGTLASYCHGGCRCSDCREANTVYHRELRKRLRARVGLPGAQVPHGTAGGYSNHGCRCRACSDAHRQAMAGTYSRRRAASRGGAT